MKKSGIILIAIVLVTSTAIAQKFQKSPKSVLTQVVGTTEVTINYHRPGLKGRALETLIANGNDLNVINLDALESGSYFIKYTGQKNSTSTMIIKN